MTQTPIVDPSVEDIASLTLEDGKRIRRALAMAPNIAFYRYRVSFKLVTS